MTRIRFLMAASLLVSSAMAFSLENYLPVSLVNHTKIADDAKVFVFVKATDPATNRQCAMQINPKTGIADCKDVSDATDLTQFNYALSDFPVIEGKPTIYISKVISGRLYFSVGYPMDLHVNPDSHLIPDPDGFKPRDSNYYTLYDKIEFSYNDAGSWINPTAVDFFSLPIRIEQPGSTTGYTQAGFFSSQADILKTVDNVFAQNDQTPDHEWQKLKLTYQNDDGSDSFLRLVAPGKAMVKAVPLTHPFDPNYLNDINRYGLSYQDALWQYYRKNTLKVDCAELKSVLPLKNYIFTGQVIGNQFIFSNGAGVSVAIDKPSSSMPYFAGAGDSFDAANNTPKAIIIRQLTSAFEVGLLPAANGVVIDHQYFLDHALNFYHQPAGMVGGPWYDLYSKALHSFGKMQPIYTFAYDDALGQDGTLHDPNKLQSQITVTLGDLSGEEIPNPYADKALYTVTVTIPDKTTVTYNGQVLSSGQILTNISVPFKVKMNGVPASIYFKHPMVRPYFNGADGIMIYTTGKTVALAFPAPPSK